MLYNGSDVIRDVEWVIFDEVHYINDSEVRMYVYVYMLALSILTIVRTVLHNGLSMLVAQLPK